MPPTDRVALRPSLVRPAARQRRAGRAQRRAAPGRARRGEAALQGRQRCRSTQRVADLLGRMTLEEKVAQLTDAAGTTRPRCRTRASDFDPAKARSAAIPTASAALAPVGHGRARLAAARAAPRRSRAASSCQRGAEVGAREHAARHPGDVPRGSAARLRRAAAPPASRMPIGLALDLGPGRCRARSMPSTGRRDRARAACSWCCRRWSTWRAIRAGAASRRPSARIRIWSARSASPRSKGSRASARPHARRRARSSPRSST